MLLQQLRQVLRLRNLLLLLRSGALVANLLLLDSRRRLCRRRLLAGAAAPAMEGQSRFKIPGEAVGRGGGGCGRGGLR